LYVEGKGKIISCRLAKGDVWIAISLFLLSIGFGIWTGLSGKPYGIALFTVHKLTGLGSVALAVIVEAGRMRHADVGGIELLFLVAGIISVIALVATGIIMSGDRPMTGLYRAVHISASAILLISGSGILIRSIMV
jgi:hypothetical protein